MGRLEEGWKEHELAQELDPSSDQLSWALDRRGEYDSAIELVQKILETRPEDGNLRWLLSEDYLQKGMYEQWLRELGRTLVLIGLPEVTGPLRHAFVTSGYEGALRHASREVERLVTSKRLYFPGALAEIYVKLGDKDRALYWLSEGVDHHHMAISDPILQWFKVDPRFAPLHADPRFKELLRRAGLPP